MTEQRTWYWRGRPLSDLTREELEEACAVLMDRTEAARRGFVASREDLETERESTSPSPQSRPPHSRRADLALALLFIVALVAFGVAANAWVTG